jgi:hypothetical protein
MSRSILAGISLARQLRSPAVEGTSTLQASPSPQHMAARTASLENVWPACGPLLPCTQSLSYTGAFQSNGDEVDPGTGTATPTPLVSPRTADTLLWAGAWET